MQQNIERHTNERNEARARLEAMAQLSTGLRGQDVDTLGTAWWNHPDMIPHSLTRLEKRWARTDIQQVARAWNELVSTVGQMAHEQEGALEVFLDLVNPGMTLGTKLLIDLLDSSNQMIGPLDTFYGDHLRVAWPAIDHWLAKQGRSDDRQLVARAALRPAIVMSMQHGPQNPLNTVLDRLPKGELPGDLPLVFQWLYAVSSQKQQPGAVETLDRLIEYGADIRATWNGQTIMAAAATYLRSLDDGLIDDRLGVLGILIERGARWEDQEYDMGPEAWDTIQDHPRVVAYRLNGVAHAARDTFAKAPKTRL